MNEEFAKSLSGHDRNQIYLVKDADEKYVYLVNGTTKMLDNPKKKSKKHIQIIKKVPIEISECLAAGLTDISIKRAIKLYNQAQ